VSVPCGGTVLTSGFFFTAPLAGALTRLSVLLAVRAAFDAAAAVFVRAGLTAFGFLTGRLEAGGVFLP